MLALASSKHFSWLLNLETFIVVNVLGALDETSRGYYRANKCH